VSAHVLEVGPSAIRRLCCGGDAVADDEMARAAFDSIDDPVTLVDLRPVTVDSLWQMVLGSVHCGSPERAIVVHPSWWAPMRVDVVSAAAQGLGCEVVMRPRSWLLAQASPPESQHATVVVEIADCFVVISGAAVVAETRRAEPQCVVEAVVRSILDMTSDVTTVVVIDAPSTVSGAGALAAMIAEGLRATDGIIAWSVGDARLRELAADVIPGGKGTCVSECAHAGDRDYRLHWRLALVVMLIIALLGVTGVLASRRHAAPADGGIPTTFLLEGRVALEVPAQWPMQRVVAGPGSARVQITSPSDPQVALHLTQSPVAVGTLDATAESLKRAIDAEPAGIFVDFNPVGTSAGRPAVTYREVRSGHDVQWTVLVDKAVRISIGCQSRHGHDDAVRQVCELAVRSARALS
jgi:type VII secretion-associated protein (TIGR03931 family)